ncbi:MAG: radical SAM protein [Oscillospiraceae bacterium]|nr:radical SAM protein [Oscillospiraceae bacterium]
MNAPFPWKLDSIVWELTLRCCFRCAYCGSRAGEARENELTTGECLSVVEQLAELGCRRVNLLGGEVFLRPDWREITAALTGRGMKVCIITSGFVLSEEILADLEALKIESVAVSLDGPERVHDRSRREGSYRRALEALNALTGRGIPTSVISALRADNVPLLPEFYETLKGYPIFAWQLQACSPMGNAEGGGLDTRFDPLEVIRFVAQEAPGAPFSILAADNIGYFTPEETAIRGGKGLCFGGCSAGLSTLGIDSVGNVRGCESLYDESFIEGNLRRRSLREIWEDDNAFTYNRRFEPRMLTGKCASCEMGEYCGGGCRSYDFFAGGKLYESPLCPRQS